MRFYTPEECEAWLAGRKRRRPDVAPPPYKLRVQYPREPYRYYFVAHWIASSLLYRQPALLWITEWGIWGSSENWHLYYKLRQTYGDMKLLHEAPGHLFLDYEAEDLTLFLQVSMLNGWGGYVLTGANYVNVFFSHDTFMDFYAEDEKNLAEAREVFTSPHWISSG